MQQHAVCSRDTNTKVNRFRSNLSLSFAVVLSVFCFNFVLFFRFCVFILFVNVIPSGVTCRGVLSVKGESVILGSWVVK